MLFAAMALSALVMLLKLFTAEVWLAEEPTVLLVLRSHPSLDSDLRRADEHALPGMHVLINDENGFAGQGLYELLTGTGWLVACVVLAGTSGYLFANRRRPEKQKALS